MGMRLKTMAFAVAGLALATGRVPAQDWPTYGHDYGDSRHSPLAQITPANVAGLKTAWTFHMRPPDRASRGFASSESTPIVVGGVMYISTPYSRVLALDAATGMERWAYQVPGSDQPATRGVAYWPGQHSEIVCGPRGGLLVALPAEIGAPVKGFGRDGVVNLHSDAVMQGFPNAQLGVTSAPVIYRNLIITGSRVQETPLHTLASQGFASGSQSARASPPPGTIDTTLALSCSSAFASPCQLHSPPRLVPMALPPAVRTAGARRGGTPPHNPGLLARPMR